MVANTSLQINCISMQNMTKRQENHDSTIVEQGRFNLRHAQEKERHTNKYKQCAPAREEQQCFSFSNADIQNENYQQILCT